MIQYILEIIAIQLVFLIIYDFWLKRETFFQWNRAYLIGSYILSMVLPWVKIEAFITTVPEGYYLYQEFLWNVNDRVAVTIAETESRGMAISWEFLLLFSGMFLSSLFFANKLRQLYLLRRKGEIQRFLDYTQIIIANSQVAFSFFNSIYIGDKVLKCDYKGVIEHELVHIKQGHTYDLLFFELMRIVCWFNPLVYIYQNRVAELHEFIADAQVARTNKKEHYQLLLSQVFETQQISFINQFFKSSLIKKRIVMLQKSQSKKIWRIKYLMLVPLVLSMLLYSSCENNISNTEKIVIVGDIESLTEVEEKKVFDKLHALSQNSEKWELFVKDGNASMKFVPSFDGSYISGSDNVRIYAKLAVDSRLTKGNYESISEFLKSKNKSLSSSLQSINTAKYHELVMERQRLLNHANENNPIIVSLDDQLRAIKESVLNNNNGTVPFNWTDEPPIFPGCENSGDIRDCFQKSMQKHISDNFKYPQEAQEQGIQGRVNIMFTIDELGNITDIRKRGPDKSLEAEAERIIQLLPKLKPGKYDGNVVKTPFSIPITFKLHGAESNDYVIKLGSNNGIVPIYIVDGVETSKVVFKKLNQDNIESIYVIRGEAAIKKYGQVAQNGVVEIKMKKKD